MSKLHYTVTPNLHRVQVCTFKNILIYYHFQHNWRSSGWRQRSWNETTHCITQAHTPCSVLSPPLPALALTTSPKLHTPCSSCSSSSPSSCLYEVVCSGGRCGWAFWTLRCVWPKVEWPLHLSRWCWHHIILDRKTHPGLSRQSKPGHWGKMCLQNLLVTGYGMLIILDNLPTFFILSPTDPEPGPLLTPTYLECFLLLYFSHVWTAKLNMRFPDLSTTPDNLWKCFITHSSTTWQPLAACGDGG